MFLHFVIRGKHHQNRQDKHQYIFWPSKKEKWKRKEKRSRIPRLRKVYYIVYCLQCKERREYFLCYRSECFKWLPPVTSRSYPRIVCLKNKKFVNSLFPFSTSGISSSISNASSNSPAWLLYDWFHIPYSLCNFKHTISISICIKLK